MAHPSVEHFLQSPGRKKWTSDDEDYMLFYQQLLGGSPWNPPYAGVPALKNQETKTKNS
jgi:hypothetical protein